jgi:hypothetical protein
MKVVNDKNLSVEQLIIALAERERDLYAQLQDMEARFGFNSHESNCAFHQWDSISEIMQNLIIGIENTEDVDSIEI